jgi:hypothetical protein
MRSPLPIAPLAPKVSEQQISVAGEIVGIIAGGYQNQENVLDACF